MIPSLSSSFLTRSLHAGLFSFLLLLGSLATQAQTNTWTGGTDTDWNTTSNWSLTLVPDVTHDVVIPSGSTNQPILSTTTTVKSVAVASSATLTINNTGSLDINGSTGFALTNRGTLDNSGTIRIGNLSAVADRGIVHYSGTLNNRPGSLIQIDRTSVAEAFYSTGVVNNEATIRIGTNAAVTGNGFTIEGGTFTNSGTLTIGTSVTGTAIRNQIGAIFTNLGEGSGCQAQIQGLILSLGNGVISNAGSFSNTGTIIENSTGNSGITFNGGVVQNNNGGTFNITTNLGLLTPGAVWTGCVSRDWNTAANWSGKIIPTTTDDAIIASAPANQPIISTTATAKTVEVESGASLSISSVGSLTINGNKFAFIIVRTGSFSAIIRFYNIGTVINEGAIVMGNLASASYGFGFANTGTFSNRADGSMTIDQSNLYNGKGSFVNAGTILLGTQSRGGLTNNASFSNTAGGYIASGDVSNQAGSTFVNSSTLTIGVSAPVLNNSLFNSGSFTNTTGGFIVIDRSPAGLINSNAFPGDEGIFVNSGIITIGASVTGGSYGMLNTGTFSNTAGGSVSIERTTRGLLNYRGSFVNSATITLGTTVSGPAIENLSGATFDNQGCPALFQSLGNALVTNAGSFSNTGTIIENASGNSNISFNGGLIVNNNGGSFTVASGNAAVSAGAGLVWQGCVSTDWNTAGNWYPATVPTATDNAVVQIGAVNQPIISTTATAKSVTITTGASLSISAMGSLSIDGSTGNALSNSGVVTNEGSLQIGGLASMSITGVGILNTTIGTLTNLPGGSIVINRTGGDGIATAGTMVNSGSLIMGNVSFPGQNNLYITEGGSFTNTVTGEIRLDRAYGNGIWNRVTSTFRNDGAIFIGSVTATGGSGILNAGTSFSNHAGGTIELEQVGRGLTNTSPFINAGRIRIGRNAPIPGGGILNGNGSNTTGATITNLAGGLIQIDAANHEGGITNEGSTTFTNSGTVTIGVSGSIVGHAINNTGTVLNQPCAVITAFAPVYNENGTFTNNGFLTVNTLRKPTKTVVRVNSPSGIARTYVFGPAGYGPNVGTVNLTADAVLVNDGTANPTQGCFSLASGSLTGKIALVDRGTCASNVKVYYAQQAGAIAVIMLSDVAGGPPGMGGGDFASLITIPAMSMTQADGAAIKAALTPGPVNITIMQEEVTSTTLVTNNGVISYPQGNPIPNVINNDLIVNSFSLCSGTSTTALQIGGANSFSVGTTWYSNPGLTTAGGTYNNGTNTFTPGSLSVGAHTLYFTTTDNVNSCSQTVAVSVTVNALPTPTLVASGSLNCTQTSVTLTASGGVSYTFANASGTLGTPGSASTLVVNAPGTYSVTVGNANGCTSTTTTTVLSDTAIPAASLSAVSLSFCAGTTLTLTASGGTAYTFSSGATQTGGSSSNTATVTQSGVYTVAVANANNCISTTTISVTAMPLTSLLSGPSASSVVCVGTSVVASVSATGIPPLSYAWYRNGSPTGQTSATLSLPNAQTTDTGSYSVVVTGACGSVTSTAFSLTVNPIPTVIITPGPSLTISSIQTATFTASGANTYNWSNLANTTAITVNVAGTYSVTGTTNGCSGTASVVLSITSAAPIITTQPATASSVCEGASVMTSVVVSNSVTGYQWLKNGSPVAGQTGPTLSLGNVQVGDAGVYSLSVTGPGGSTTSNGFTLTVNPLPTATITFPNSVTVAGSPVPVVRVPSLNPPVVFQAFGGVLYERLIILDRINGYEIRQNDSNTTGIFPINRLGLFTLTVTGAGGCKRTVQWVVQQQ